MPGEPINDNPQPESTPHFDDYSGKTNGASSFDINSTPKPEPISPIESQQPVKPVDGPVPVGNGPMTAFSPNSLVPPEQVRAPEAQSNEQSIPEPVVAKPKWYKSKKFIVAIIAAIVIVALAGGSAFAYTYYQNPQKVIMDSLVNTITSKSVIYTGNLNVENKDNKVTVTISGKAADTTGDVDVKLAITSNGKSYNVNGSGVYDKKGDIYFKVGGLRAIVAELKTSLSLTQSASAAVDKLVNRIDNQWIKISSNDLKQYSADAATTKNCFNETMNKYKNDKTAIKEFTDLYSKNQFIVVDKELGQKDGNLGYQIKTSNAKIKSFAEGAKETKIYKSLHECDKSFVIDTTNMSTKDEDNGNVTVKLWANMWTHQLAKFEVNGSEDGTTVSAVLEPKFNQTVNVEAPSSSISLSQLQTYIQDLYSSLYGGNAQI